MPQGIEQPATAEYGIDDPPRVIALVFLGFASIMGGIFVGAGFGSPVVSVPVWLAGLALLGSAVGRAWSAKVAKGEAWDGVLGRAGLRGDEDALDVGCGRGLVLLKLAQRLPDRTVVGLDIWSNRHQSGNYRAVTEANAGVVGVADRIELHDGDVRRLPFPDASFDLVTAGYVLDGLATDDDRARAAAQIVRVLRPDGRALVLDRGKARRSAAAFAATGATVAVSRPSRPTHPGSTLLTVTPPAAA